MLIEANAADGVVFSAISMWYLDTPRVVLAQVGNAWRGFGGATGDAIVRLRVDQVLNFGVLRVLGEDG